MKRIGLLLCSILATGGCDVFGINGIEDDLKEQRREWLRQGIRNYSYEYTLSCFCPQLETLIITVRNDTVHSVVTKQSGQTFTPAPGDNIRTMTELYDYLIDVAEEADDMEVEFDTRLHIPTLVSVDRIKNAIDDEFAITVANFEVISP